MPLANRSPPRKPTQRQGRTTLPMWMLIPLFYKLFIYICGAIGWRQYARSAHAIWYGVAAPIPATRGCRRIDRFVRGIFPSSSLGFFVQVGFGREKTCRKIKLKLGKFLWIDFLRFQCTISLFILWTIGLVRLDHSEKEPTRKPEKELIICSTQ